MSVKNTGRSIWVLLAIVVSWHSLYAQRGARKEDDNDEWKAEYFFAEGEKYYLLEDFAKSLESFQKAYDFNPENAAINYKLAQIYSRSEDINKALYYINRSLEASPDNKYYYLLASDLHTRNGDIKSATDTYKEMVETIPGTDEYLFELAALYLYNDKLDDALKTYNQIESKLGVSEETSFQKINIYDSQGKTDLALKEIDKLINTFPGEPSYSVRQCEMLMDNGQLEKAIENLEGIVADYPTYSRARLLLSDAYERSGQNDKSRQNLMIAFEDSALDPNIKIQIINSYRTGANIDREFVTELAETIGRAHKGNPTVKVLIGDIYLDYNENDKALENYLEAVEIDPSVFNVWDNIMKLEFTSDKMQDVITHSESAMELFPNQYSPFFFNGLANIRSQNFNEGINALNEAKKRTRDPAVTLECSYWMGEAYNGLKEYKKSDEAFESVLKVDPNNNITLNNYSYYLSLRKENLDRAKELSARLIELNPDNPTYLDTYAWVLFQKEEYKEAKKIMERAIRSANANAVHFEHYGDILFKLGEIDAAVEQWKEAKKLNSNSKLIDKKIADRKLYN